MDTMASPMERRIFLFGQGNLNNSVLIGYLHQHIQIDCQLIDLRQWRTDWLSDGGRLLALIDASSATPDRIQDLLELIHDRYIDTIIAFYNVSPNHPIERLIAWPNVNGLFYTNTSDQMLARGISCMFDGELWIPRYLIASFLNRNRQRPRRVTSFSGLLTKREKQILRLTATGATNTEIAEALSVSMHTVKTHVYNLFKKIGVSNRIQAVNWAKEHMDELLRETVE